MTVDRSLDHFAHMNGLKPIKLWGHVAGPHPWKVILILKELEIPFKLTFLNAKEMKQDPYISICPNGLVPTIEDPNTGIILWESSTIVEYLEDQYDLDEKLKHSSFPEVYHQKKWQHFQIAAQDTFFGQRAYYTMFHTEQDLTSVHEHYAKMIRHILSVIETQLTKSSFLTGEKCTYADLMFVPFNVDVTPNLMGPEFQEEWSRTMPKSYQWHQRLLQRTCVKEAFQEKHEAMAARGWPTIGASTRMFQDAK